MRDPRTTRVLLPGGAGLVGQNLVACLRSHGYTDIVVIDKHERNLAVLRKVQPDVLVEYADLAKRGEWECHFKDADVVVMLQAQIGGIYPDEFARNNVDSTRNILDAMERHRVPYLVHVSSSVLESVANDFYTSSKRKQEELVLKSSIPHVVLRPTLMFGWFDRKHLGWLSRFMKKVPVFPIPGHGRYMRQPLFAKDFCEIIVSCVKSRQFSGVYNISGRAEVDYIDMIREIRSAVGSRALIVKIPYGLFYFLLWVWACFDRNPPFTTQQLSALVANDEFEVIDWPNIFGVTCTPFPEAIDQTFNDPQYSRITLEF